MTENSSQRFELQGDACRERGELREALRFYEASEQLDPSREAIYHKLVDTLESLKEEWTETDFSNSLSWTMRIQELEQPTLRRVHQKLSPEFEQLRREVERLMLVPDAALEAQLTERLLGSGELGALALVDYLLHLKKTLQRSLEAHFSAGGDLSE